MGCSMGKAGMIKDRATSNGLCETVWPRMQVGRLARSNRQAGGVGLMGTSGMMIHGEWMDGLMAKEQLAAHGMGKGDG